VPVSSLELQPPGDPILVVPHESPSPLTRAYAWVRLNGVIFTGEVLIIWVLIESFQYLGYGGQVGQAQGGPPFPVTMLMCALAGTYRNPHTNPERYIGIVLDGLRAADKRRSQLPPIAES